MITRKLRLILLALLMPALASADVKELDDDALKALQASGVTIIDVRRQDEWSQTGMISGSHAVTFFDEQGRYDVKLWLEQVASVAKPEDPIVLICAHGVRSSKIAELLDKRLGYSQVHNVTKGIASWIKNGKPVVPWEPASR